MDKQVKAIYSLINNAIKANLQSMSKLINTDKESLALSAVNVIFTSTSIYCLKDTYPLLLTLILYTMFWYIFLQTKPNYNLLVILHVLGIVYFLLDKLFEHQQDKLDIMKGDTIKIGAIWRIPYTMLLLLLSSYLTDFIQKN